MPLYEVVLGRRVFSPWLSFQLVLSEGHRSLHDTGWLLALPDF
jgi:hypothetical protein